jgi:mevalonate kinase
MKPFFAHGKLLISAEYMVLHGSLALALPLHKGQSLQRLRSEDRDVFSWDAYEAGNRWFSAKFNPATLGIIETSDQEKAENLRFLIKTLIEIDPSFQKELFTWDVETVLEFSPKWGFGSSSTLIALMAEWAEINPLDLHFRVSDGSGYDVACALTERPILYKLREDGPHYRHVRFNPPFAKNLYFVWLGKKQSTAEHLVEMANKINPGYQEILHFTTLTQQMTEATELSEFRQLMEEHEAKLSELIKLDRVSATLFPDLPGSVKSLGAWGGDFVLIATESDSQTLYNYLDKKGFNTIFRYNDLVYDAKRGN